MCCQKVSDFITLNKCCCGIPLKIATYIAGSFMLIYCTFAEIESIQHIVIRTAMFDESEPDEYGLEPELITGAGVGAVDHAMRSRDGFQLTWDYRENFMRGLLIAWTVINGFHIVSTCLMLYGNAKNKSVLLLQWLVVIATIAIGNLLDIVFEVIYVQRVSAQGYNPLKGGSLFFILICLAEIVAIIFAFVVVRSYYYRLTLPSIPVSFKTLESRENQDIQEEEEYTANKP